ncbi:MAG: T9SS type A sorting domain-containing protein [Bacteroidota bacterium]
MKKLILLLFMFFFIKPFILSATFAVSYTINAPKCYGSLTGSFSDSISGGTPPYRILVTDSVGDTVSIANTSINPYFTGGLRAGIYVVTILDAVGNSSIDTVVLTQPPGMAVSIYLSSDTLCFGDSILAIGFVNGGNPPINIGWYNGISWLYNDTVYFYIADTIRMIAADNNGCSYASDTIIYPCNNFSGVEEIDLSSKVMELFPNPTTYQLNINLGNFQAEHVSIYNTDGQLLTDIKQPANNNIDVSNLATGVYIAEVKVKGVLQRVRWTKM